MSCFKITIQFLGVFLVLFGVTKGETDDEVADNLFYTLYTGTTPYEYEGIPIKNGTDLLSHPLFDKNKITAFYAGGWSNDIETPVAIEPIKAYLQLKHQYNVVQLNYTIYDKNPIGTYTFPKTVQVGVVFGKNLQWLVDNGLNPTLVHLFGVSLGGQLVGQIVRHVKVELVVGLDPAGPLFNHVLPGFKKGYANRTIVIHADRYLMGMNDMGGDMDFMLNDGTAPQPGCIAGPLGHFCSHVRVLYIWALCLLHPKLFMATKCDYWNSCRLRCNLTDVVALGPDARGSGVYYLKTLDKTPYGMGEEGYKHANRKGLFPFCKEKM